MTFGNVWALLVDGRFGPGLPPAEPFPIPVHSGDVRVDVQAGLAMLAPYWGYKPLLDITDDEARENLARASVMALSYIAQSARGIGVPAVPQRRIDECATITERFMRRLGGRAPLLTGPGTDGPGARRRNRRGRHAVLSRMHPSGDHIHRAGVQGLTRSPRRGLP